MEAKKARSKFYHQTSQQSYYMKPSEANLVKLHDPKLQQLVEVSFEQRPRIAIVLMTKRPIDFEQWLAYHHSVVGVERFYVQCEDTPELAQLVCHPPWNECVEATFVAKTHRDYFVQMDRQATHIASAVPRAKAAGMEWLLHIDDDEMLYCPHGPGALWGALRAVPSTSADIHVQNIEALTPNASCVSPFASCVTFIISTSRYASYTNGKSFGRVSRPGLRAHGPHHFRADGADSGTVDLPASFAVVLHYESCTFERWSQKFRDLAERHGDDPDIIAKLPFPFYRESLAAMNRVSQAVKARARLQKQQARRLADDTSVLLIDELTRAAFVVWARRKLQSQAKLAPHEVVVVTAVAEAIARLFPDVVPSRTTNISAVAGSEALPLQSPADAYRDGALCDLSFSSSDVNQQFAHLHQQHGSLPGPSAHGPLSFGGHPQARTYAHVPFADVPHAAEAMSLGDAPFYLGEASKINFSNTLLSATSSRIAKAIEKEHSPSDQFRVPTESDDDTQRGRDGQRRQQLPRLQQNA